MLSELGFRPQALDGLGEALKIDRCLDTQEKDGSIMLE